MKIGQIYNFINSDGGYWLCTNDMPHFYPYPYQIIPTYFYIGISFNDNESFNHRVDVETLILAELVDEI